MGIGTSILELRDANSDVFEWVNSDLNDVNLSFRHGSVSSVPLPAASWMFASGLIGLFQISRKKARA